MDLSRGFETFDKHDDSQDEHLISLLKSIAEYEKVNGRVDVGIVTWRGMMTKVDRPVTPSCSLLVLIVVDSDSAV